MPSPDSVAAGAALDAYWRAKCVTHGRLYLVAGAAIAVAVAASSAMLGMHISSERESRTALEKQVDEVKRTIDTGFREVRQDIKELLRKGQ